MTAYGTINDLIAVLRAVEGIPLLVFALGCVLFSIYIRKEPLF